MTNQLSAFRLIEGLEDQLSQFPLASVIRSHDQLVDESLQAWRERIEPFERIGGLSRRQWDVPMELLYDEIGVLLGAMFVLLQAAVTETVSIVKRVYELHGQSISKEDAMALESGRDMRTEKNYPAIVNAAANFYKHRYEWPADWDAATGKGSKDTIAFLQSIGMSAGSELADNLLTALDVITRDSCSSRQQVATLVIESWRDRLCKRLMSDFGDSPLASHQA